jgi:hypothetical protein
MILMTGKTDAETGKNWMLINTPGFIVEAV